MSSVPNVSDQTPSTLKTLSYPNPANRRSTAKSHEVLVYFITGNPGLIGFYEPFLSTLSEGLVSSKAESTHLQKTNFHVLGKSFPGFSDQDHDEPFNNTNNPPRDVAYQIEHTLATLSALRIETGERTGEAYDDILLMGHSVGAYIALRVFQRALNVAQQDYGLESKLHISKSAGNMRNVYHGEEGEPNDDNSYSKLPLRAAILLFPTICHIARSPNGRNMDFLRRTPTLGNNVHLVARAFLRFVPSALLRLILRRVVRFPEHAASTTLQWLESHDGLRQTLFMGMDEMQAVGDLDEWVDEVWGSEKVVKELEGVGKGKAASDNAEDGQNNDEGKGVKPKPKFILFFGKNDPWVADQFRDELIEKAKLRGELDVDRLKILVDEDEALPHAFCMTMKHSEIMARKVRIWIEEMYT